MVLLLVCVNGVNNNQIYHVAIAPYNNWLQLLLVLIASSYCEHTCTLFVHFHHVAIPQL